VINETLVSDDDDDSEEEEVVEKKDEEGDKGQMLIDEETEKANETEIQEKDSIREEKVSLV
jgi:hypothetical protein